MSPGLFASQWRGSIAATYFLKSLVCLGDWMYGLSVGLCGERGHLVWSDIAITGGVVGAGDVEAATATIEGGTHNAAANPPGEWIDEQLRYHEKQRSILKELSQQKTRTMTTSLNKISMEKNGALQIAMSVGNRKIQSRTQDTFCVP